MSILFEFLATKLDTLGYRVSLLNEIGRLRSKGRYFPVNVFNLIMSAPDRYDDFVQLVGFFNNNDIINLIDIGANHGEFSKDFHLFFPKNEFIFCFEPNPNLRDIVKKNLSQIPNVKLFYLGLGDKKKKLKLNVPELSDGLSSFLTLSADANSHYAISSSKEYLVPVDRLDNIVGELQGTIIVKIDTQGFESKVIEGGQKTLLKSDAVLLECSFAPMHEDDDEPSFNSCNVILSDLGFVPVVFQRYGTKINTYAFERDVLYVKKELSKKVFHKNS